jgi:hypothetical protein
MGDRIKQLLLLAVVVVGAWQGWKRYQRSQVSGSFEFVVEGPGFCAVEIRAVAGDQATTETRPLPWRSAPRVVTGGTDLDLQVDIPLSCGWQPEQVRCSVLKDGAPFREGETTRVMNPQDGTPRALRCAVPVS